MTPAALYLIARVDHGLDRDEAVAAVGAFLVQHSERPYTDLAAGLAFFEDWLAAR